MRINPLTAIISLWLSMLVMIALNRDDSSAIGIALFFCFIGGLLGDFISSGEDHVVYQS